MATRLTGDGAVEALFRENEADLKSYVRGKLGRSGAVDVDDIVQEAFLRIARQQRSTDIDNPRGFLFRTARNLTFDLLRRRGVRDTYNAAQAADPRAVQAKFESESAEQAASTTEELRTILNAVEQLPPQCQRVFLLQRQEGLRYAEIAKRLGISQSMVQKHMTKALVRLADALT